LECELASSIPFFRSGGRVGAAGGEQLGLMSGLLLYDSGEAEQTFLYRCQDRYLTYNSICGLRTVLFVADQAHQAVYRSLIQEHDRRIRLIRERTGIPLPKTPPVWFATVDLCRLEPVTFPSSYTMALNQVSPMCSHLVGECLRPLGEIALQWHDKSHYVRAASSAPQGLPLHAATALVSMDEFRTLATWQDLCSLWRERTGAPEPAALYVKSSFDSGGNAAARLSRSSFDAAMRRLQASLRCGPDLAQLRSDIGMATSLAGRSFSEKCLRGFLRDQRGRRGNVCMLVQEAIESPEDGGIHGLGITCNISPADCVEIVAAAGQLYRDPGRHHYAGSYLDDMAVGKVLTQQVQRLCSLLARDGYRGPVNFDARRGATDEWVFLYDCNPRLSAVYPALAVRQFLRSHHYEVRTLANFGYRGEFASANLDRLLSDLEAAGLLCRDARLAGILPLPNLARERGLDFFAVNIPYSELGALAARYRSASGLEFRVF
jgi:hypothetical protein